jgi:hypothetical protein
VNVEQFESAMLNVSIKLILVDYDMNEIEREFDVDDNDNLVCIVTGKNLRGEQAKFKIQETSPGQWKGYKLD